MAKFFISYRRNDSAQIVGRIHEHIVRHFGKGSVFIDVENIPGGSKFENVIKESVAKCDALLVIIGQSLVQSILHREKEGLEDHVRIEIEEAIKQDVQLVPILVGDATMPARQEFPPSISVLYDMNAFTIDVGRHFRTNMDQIIRFLDSVRVKKTLEDRDIPREGLIVQSMTAIRTLLNDALDENGYSHDIVTIFSRFDAKALDSLESTPPEKVALFLYRIVLDSSSLLELHFLISANFSSADKQYFYIGWVINFFLENPTIQFHDFLLEGMDAIPKGSIFQILPSSTEPREIWNSITNDPYQISVPYILRITH